MQIQNKKFALANGQWSMVKCSQRGFTALEILIVIAILGILVAVIFPPLINFRRSSVLNVETQEMVTLINKARLSSMSSKGDVQYGVHFATTSITIFQGATYVFGATGNEEHVFDPTVSIGTAGSIVVNGGGTDVLFQRITGATDQNATTTLSVVANTSASSTVVVRSSGVVTLY
jgi:prepilin-type N-terminal cleavage/methylation domain-containing protein